jgi:hypothetical protein
MSRQSLWQRITLLIVLAYEGLGSLAGGAMLVARPDGRLMNIPLAILHGVFADFLIPGVILFGLGVLNVVAFVAVLRRSRLDWLFAGLALGGLAIWFIVEIAIVRELVWLHAMWGLPVILGLVVALPLVPASPLSMRNAALACGVASSLLYVAMNLLVPLQWPGYDQASRIVSELSAVGAPTRPLWVVLGIAYTLLVVAFGWGVWAEAGGAEGDRRLRITGALLIAYGALGVVWPFAPMHLREAIAAGQGDLRDSMHIALGVATNVIYLAALGVAAAALGKAFRIYSLATLVVLLACAVLTFQQAPRVSANQPTPLIGVWERIDIGVFLLWMVVLAVVIVGRRRPRVTLDACGPDPGGRRVLRSSWLQRWRRSPAREAGHPPI